MNKFIIEQDNEQKNEEERFLKQDIQAFYHGNHTRWNDTEVGYINTLKNDDNTFSDEKREFGYTLSEAKNKLRDALFMDLPQILQEEGRKSLTVCVVPRAKAEYRYHPEQLLFKRITQKVVSESQGLFDGTDYIMRHIDTPTTHLGGERPKKSGITINTCNISDEVKGKNILLIDDLYTKNTNIDEDAIQALLDNGAQSVIFYAVGKTVHNNI